MTDLCLRVEAIIDETAAGGAVAHDLRAHLGACADCQARLALAVRIDRALAGWPVAAPPPHFAARIAGRARQLAWRQEVVIDWGFNLALAASLASIVFGAGSFLWLLGTLADPADASRLATGQLASLVGRARGQAPVVATATALLATTVGAVWWAEARRRW